MLLFIEFCEGHWIIPWLLPFILGLLAGWLIWGKYIKMKNDLQDELSGLRTELSDMEGKLDECKAKRASLDSEVTMVRGQMEELKAQIASESDKKPTSKKKTKKSSTPDQDDFKVIEGVGPKIEQLLKEGGFETWRSLSYASVEDIKAVLDKAGSRYRLADPSTWPKQAEMAADGRWDDLKEYMDFLHKGL